MNIEFLSKLSKKELVDYAQMNCNLTLIEEESSKEELIKSIAEATELAKLASQSKPITEERIREIAKEEINKALPPTKISQEAPPLRKDHFHTKEGIALGEPPVRNT